MPRTLASLTATILTTATAATASTTTITYLWCRNQTEQCTNCSNTCYIVASLALTFESGSILMYQVRAWSCTEILGASKKGPAQIRADAQMLGPSFENVLPPCPSSSLPTSSISAGLSWMSFGFWAFGGLLAWLVGWRGGGGTSWCDNWAVAQVVGTVRCWCTTSGCKATLSSTTCWWQWVVGGKVLVHNFWGAKQLCESTWWRKWVVAVAQVWHPNPPNIKTKPWISQVYIGCRGALQKGASHNSKPSE